jgi:hypothetical protein
LNDLDQDLLEQRAQIRKNAVRFRGKVFGDEYASLLSKAADVASQSERKAAAAVRA